MKRASQGALIAPVLAIALAAVACNRSEPQQTTTDATPTPAASTTAAEPRGDSALATAVQAKFYADERVRGQLIAVSAESGSVTLRGTVPSQAAKEQAVTLARSVEGVTRSRSESAPRAVRTPVSGMPTRRARRGGRQRRGSRGGSRRKSRRNTSPTPT